MSMSESAAELEAICSIATGAAHDTAKAISDMKMAIIGLYHENKRLSEALAKAKSDTATCCMVAGQVAKEAVL